MGSNGYWRGPSNLNEIAATLDMPGMHRKTFVSIEKQIGQAWETLLAEEMTKAGEEERQLAIQKKESFEGVPAITGCGCWVVQAIPQAQL